MIDFTERKKKISTSRDSRNDKPLLMCLQISPVCVEHSICKHANQIQQKLPLIQEEIRDTDISV